MHLDDELFIVVGKGDYRRLSPDAYNRLFEENSSDDVKKFLPKSKREKALKFAIRRMDFEITNYWKRAAYFWAFVTVIYAAYLQVLKFYSSPGEGCIFQGCQAFDFGHIPTLVLAGLGLVFSIAWILSSKGSKHWQENWENHIHRLEEPIMGPIFDIYKPNSFSVSKVNLMLGYIVATCAGGLFAVEAVNFCKKFGQSHGIEPMVLCTGILLFAIFGIAAFVLWSVGNRVKKMSENKKKKFPSEIEKTKSVLLAIFLGLEVALAVFVALSMALVEIFLLEKIGISVGFGVLVGIVVYNCCSAFFDRPKLDSFGDEK